MISAFPHKELAPKQSTKIVFFWSRSGSGRRWSKAKKSASTSDSIRKEGIFALLCAGQKNERRGRGESKACTAACFRLSESETGTGVARAHRGDEECRMTLGNQHRTKVSKMNEGGEREPQEN